MTLSCGGYNIRKRNTCSNYSVKDKVGRGGRNMHLHSYKLTMSYAKWNIINWMGTVKSEEYTVLSRATTKKQRTKIY